MLGALAAHFINADPLPAMFLALFFVDSENSTFLELFDMYLIIFVIFSQNFVILIQYTVMFGYIIPNI